METRFIMPFMNSIKNVFGTMLKTTVGFGQPSLKSPGQISHGVSGIISFTGSVGGTIVVCMPLIVAKDVIRRFTGAIFEPDDPDFIDAIGELVNMIAGGAKSSFGREDVAISCPSVVMGQDHQLFQRKDQAIIIVPCQSEAGVFHTEIGLKVSQAAEKPKLAAAG